MNITARVAGQAEPVIIHRGEDYYRRGLVDIVEGSLDRVVAYVSGTRLYQVKLFVEDFDWLEYFCTCPYYEREQEPCKHVWATLLAAEASGDLGALEGDDLIELEPVGFVDPEEEADTFIDDAEPRVTKYSGESHVDGDDFDRLAYIEDRVRRVEPPDNIRRIVRRGQGPHRRELNWRDHLEHLQDAILSAGDAGKETHSSSQHEELIYILNRDRSYEEQAPVLEINSRTRKRNGSVGTPRRFKAAVSELDKLPNAEDRRIMPLILGAQSAEPWRRWHYLRAEDCEFVLRPGMCDMLIPLMCGTGRFYMQLDDESYRRPDLRLLALDEGAPWELQLKVDPSEDENHWSLCGVLKRGVEIMQLDEPCLLLSSGWFFTSTRAARLDDHSAFPWIAFLRKEKSLQVPRAEEDSLLELLCTSPKRPPIDWPESLRPVEVQVPLQPRVKVLKPEHDFRRHPRLRVNVEFRYGEVVVQAAAPQGDLFQREGRKLIRRDPDAENAAMARLRELGCQPPPRSSLVYRDMAGHVLELAPSKLPHLVGALVKADWSVEAEGKLYRQAEGFSMSVRSGVDWFDLGGGVVFNGKAVGLPRLLEAVRRKENTVILDDGSLGVLPETWLKRFGLLLSTGQVHEDQLRFRSSQVLILDALLAAEGENKWDKTFEKARASLRRFDGIKASTAPKGFNGRLRPYQEEGLGWLEFLQGFGFGGCLADDMGLGKTIQVLALLESRRSTRGKRKGGEVSSLVVVPRSLIFNWLSEAARFTPKLRILNYTGPARIKEKDLLERHDVVLTTYGTMRSDVTFLKDIPFDYVVLDESQAIKNSASQAAKAARLLKGSYRLGMSGTPIENHLGELWSLFEFLNPGMLGSSKAFKNFAVNGKPAEGGEDQGANQLLAHVIRPFILRRTKQEVAKDLPEKVEQTVFCDLKAKERKLYDEVREFYRASLLGKIETAGLKRVKIQVLEALLRLRQAACHPGLLDRDRQEESSTKLELLLDRLREVHEENHKALVFSQFTSLLAIVRQKLAADNITYEYLDGRTRNRGARVERFQSDPDCKLFLISLKAGGLGLNLTAAEYIFLLDPWWNPAVESQAIDRAHRIGQRRRVFAYRLIARDTVEEKVLELQQKKRRLADAIISGDGSILRDLTREDLEFILS